MVIIREDIMFQSIRKRIIRNTVIKVVVSILIIAGILVGSKLAPIKYFQGPEKVDINDVDADEIMDKYVQVNIKAVYDNFLEETTTTKKHGITTSTRTSAQYYIVGMNNEAFYIGLRVEDDNLVDKVNEQSNQTFSTEDVTTLDDLVLNGTLTEMSSEEYSNFESFLTEGYGLSSEYISHYLFKVNYISYCSETVVYLCIGGIALSLLFAIISLINGLSGRYIKDVKKLSDEMNISIDQIEAELNAIVFKNVWVGKRFTAFLKGTKIRILKNQDYIWSYYKETTQKRKGVTTVTRHIIMVDRNKKNTMVPVASEDNANTILGFLFQSQPQMVIGFSDELKQLFKDDFERFLRLPYEQQNINEDTAQSVQF
jgi:hypothetical protein